MIRLIKIMIKNYSSVLKYKEPSFVLSLVIITLTKFIEKNILVKLISSSTSSFL